MVTSITLAKKEGRLRSAERDQQPDETDEFVQQVVAEQQRRQAAAEAICERIARDGNEPSPAELSLLRSVAPPSTGREYHRKKEFRDWLERQVGRIKYRLTLQERAGTERDRELARSAAEAAVVARQKEGPAIEAEIRKLQDTLAALDQAVTVTQADVDRQTAAVIALCDEARLPEVIQDQLRALRRQHEAEFAAELRTLQARSAALDQVLAYDPDKDVEKIRMHIEPNIDCGTTTAERVERFFRQRKYDEADVEAHQRMLDGRSRLTSQFYADKLNVTEWKAYCGTIRTELETNRKRISELEHRKAEADQDVEALRRHFVK